jgi:hypothetical protein
MSRWPKDTPYRDIDPIGLEVRERIAGIDFNGDLLAVLGAEVFETLQPRDQPGRCKKWERADAQ